MGFLAFMYLLIIAVVVALLLPCLPKLKARLPGGIITTIIVGYIGARLGVPLFGNWGLLFKGANIIPAILGAIAAILLAKSAVECCKK